MDREYLQNTQLVFLKRVLLDKYKVKDDSIIFDYNPIENRNYIANYANKGINFLLLLVTLERELDIKIPVKFVDPAKQEAEIITHESIDKFLTDDEAGFECRHLFFDDEEWYRNQEASDRYDKVCSSMPSLLNILIEIRNVASIKEKIKQFLDSYISAYEKKELVGANILTLEKHSEFSLKLFDSLKSFDQRNLLIDSETLSKNLPDIYSPNSKAQGQLRLLEHLLLFEKKGYIGIKDVDLSTIDSMFPAETTIAIIKPLCEIAEKEGVSLQDSNEGLLVIARNTEDIKSKKSSKIPVFNEETRKVAFNGKEWTLKTKNSKQFYVLRILLNKKPGTQMTIEEIKKHYRNDNDALQILRSDSGRWIEDLVRDINYNAKKHLDIDELLRCKGSTIELLKV